MQLVMRVQRSSAVERLCTSCVLAKTIPRFKTSYACSPMSCCLHVFAEKRLAYSCRQFEPTFFNVMHKIHRVKIVSRNVLRLKCIFSVSLRLHFLTGSEPLLH